MIAYVHGPVQTSGHDYLVLDVHGVGLLINVPKPVAQAFSQRPDAVKVYTYLHVREDALTLYGFESPAQRALFELLLGVSGIGPKVALGLLSAASPEDLQVAIAREDTLMLSQVPGIGKKTAARLVLELRGKFTTMVIPATTEPGQMALNSELAEILMSLGYSATEAHAAINALPKDAPAEIEERLRVALQYFGGA